MLTKLFSAAAVAGLALAGTSFGGMQDQTQPVGITPDVPVTVPTNTPAGQDPILDKALSILGTSASLPEAWPIAA